MPTEELFNAYSEPPTEPEAVVDLSSKTTQILGYAGADRNQFQANMQPHAYPTPAPSRPINKINIPEVVDPKATFVYNYFTRDERVRPDSTNATERIVTLDASNTDEIFYRVKNKKLARFVQISFTPPKKLPRRFVNINGTSRSSRSELGSVIDLTDALNKITVEGASSDEVFTGIELIDTGKEGKLYAMLNGALFFTDISTDNISNREAISKLHDTLSEKGGLRGQDKKILFESFRNFTPAGSTDSQHYMLAETDVSPEVAKFASDPIGKQSISVQFNNLFMAELVSNAVIIPDNVFQDELRALINPATVARQETLIGIPPVNTFREIDYELQVNAVKLQELNMAAKSSDEKEAMLKKYPEIIFAGYLMEKYETLPDESVEYLGRRYITNRTTNFAIDSDVRYGGSYFYKIRTVCQVKTIVHTIQQNAACSQALLATCFMASEGKIFDVSCIERIPPPPPTNLHTTFDFETLVPRLTWQFPLNKQRDIKRFQIFKRLSVNEPFVLLHEYNFDNSIIKSPVAEVADGQKVIDLARPRTYYTDVTHQEGEKPIYAIACVDAHGLSSNYSAQIKVERDRYTNRVKQTIISRGDAPKPYPNIYLNVDTFQDAIKVSNYNRVKIIFDPEYYRVVKNINNSNGKAISERDMNLLAIDNENFRYKFHFINIDNQLDQTVNIKLYNYASAGTANEDTFKTSVATFSENNFSFQYGVE